MKVGDLIIDIETRDVGILIEIDWDSPERQYNVNGEREPYRILNVDGYSYWFGADYIEEYCEVISKSS